MKQKIISIFLLLSIISLNGCQGVKDEPSIITKENGTNIDFKQNDEVIEITENTLQTSTGEFNIIYKIDENNIEINGNLEQVNEKYILLDFAEADEEKNAVPITNGSFSIKSAIPDSKDELTVNLFWGEAQYGNFDSIVYDFVQIEKNQNKWTFKSSPVLENNITIYNKEKDINESLAFTEYIQSNEVEIIQLSNEITAGSSTDYEKVLKIHNWVAENIYYDFEAFYSGNYQNASSLNVLHSKKAVCEGYANLFAALVRVQNIPCRVQSGYALGIDTDKKWSKKAIATQESNHAWNEAYVDGRWLIIDTTWDSENKIENGNMIKGKLVNHIYFDSDIQFFSLSHKSLE